MTPDWSNWSGSVVAHPARIPQPNSEDEVVAIVREAAKNRQTVRVTGTGHSFSSLCASDGVIISLDNLRGVIDTGTTTREALVHAGTKLHALGAPLHAAGLAMENMGDIDRQSIAGVVGTGTHGTGHGIGNISNQVVGLRFVTASGDVIECSADKDPEIFKAAQVSLGALGVMTQIRLRCVPAYNLHEKTWTIKFDECMANLDRHIQENRHFEFFWSAEGDSCYMKALNPTEREPNEMKDVRGERIDFSYRIFPSVRNIKFNEIEFAIPEANGPDCLRELRDLMMTKHTDVKWPLEYRTVAADDIFLSPDYRRDSITISAHDSASKPYESFFRDVEAIFRNHQGRPHWGKLHWHTTTELQPLYPMWDRFQKVLQALDPNGVFLNDHLRTILT